MLGRKSSIVLRHLQPLLQKVSLQFSKGVKSVHCMDGIRGKDREKTYTFQELQPPFFAPLLSVSFVLLPSPLQRCRKLLLLGTLAMRLNERAWTLVRFTVKVRKGRSVLRKSRRVIRNLLKSPYCSRRAEMKAVMEDLYGSNGVSITVTAQLK